MLRCISATPCPVPTTTDQTSRRDSIFDATFTTNIDYTTDFTRVNLLTGVRPRRRQTNVHREVVIHEDGRTQDVLRRGEGGPNLGGSLLAKPAKRLQGRMSFVGDVQEAASGHVRPARMPLGRIAEIETRMDTKSMDARMVQPPRQRVTTTGPSNLKRVPHEATATLPVNGMIQGERTLAKPPRRGTIYIPPDDTTMPSMYMGIFSPVKETEHIVDKPGEEAQVNLTAIATETAKRRGRRSSLAAEPARRVGPLRSVLEPVKEHDTSFKMNVSQDVDRAGAVTGKENLPPGFNQRDFAYHAKCSQDIKPFARSAAGYARQTQRQQNVLVSSLPAPTKSQAEHRKPAWNSGASSKAPTAHTHTSMPPILLREPCKEPKMPTHSPRVPSRFVLPRLHQEQPQFQHFPPLSEDIGNPAAYEDNWLTHQEIAITQLLNNLFSSASSLEPVDPDLLRLDLLDLYQSSNFVLLHKRLQGAILYGALRVPENLLLHAKRLQNDLGVRRVFIDLWIHSYERVALKTALEVVIGRQCSNTSKDIRTFIEVFLIRNEDGGPGPECEDQATWCYRRTILRSLMVIQLLDHAKAMPKSTLTTSLFLTASPHKSSIEVLRALIQLLNPSMGQRALSHLEYTLEHKQHPLEEYEHLVTNLAVDLRDGVRLTRLVELLLYPSASPCLVRGGTDDSMLTLNMPTGEVLSMLDIESPTKSTRYPLSQHLKFPCEGRAVKIFNAQIALTALEQVRGMPNSVEDVSAKDIVNGFREKTVALLWALTGKWGLGSLVDWKDVRSEIVRLQKRKTGDGDNSDLVDEDELEELSHSFTGHKSLLKAWAVGVASAKGLTVHNLTTSFADGRVFEAIIDEYETYLPWRSNGSSPTSSKKALLHERLAELGCSAQFSSLFVPSTTGQRCQIFDCDFTLAALAFLCSRLLSASKRARASVVVQRTWRHYQLRLEARKRRMVSTLAHQCAEVVRTRERLLRSKRTIVKAWRARKAQTAKRAVRKKKRLDDPDDTNLEAGDLWLTL